MELKVFTIYDRIAKESAPLFTAKDFETAKRIGSNSLLSREFREGLTIMIDDYELRYLCDYNTESCQINPVDLEVISLNETYRLLQENMWKESEEQHEFRKDYRASLQQTRQMFLNAQKPKKKGLFS